ncbi:MAG TPA: DUF3570 domain-containing protein [Thermoanaerobaculia bacterium]|nr:DUF3570 domain-containing protein [Thermoanaerobaculia bacterium]
MRLQLKTRAAPRRRARRRTAIARSLFAATAALLGAAAGPSIAQEADPSWGVDASVSYYGEQDRVKDASVNARVRYRLRRGALSLRFALDTLTGASASGAAPSAFPQTFTSPSGNDSYQIGARKTPLDPTFHDTRFALALTYQRPLTARSDVDVGVSFSTEYDYTHLGVNGRYGLALNERNTTFALGLAFAHDTVRPVGGTPIPFAPMLELGDTSNKLGNDSKNVLDVLFGVTQVLGKRTIAELSYSFSRSNGYLTDPYKILSVVDPVTGDPVVGPGIPYLYLFEKRPGERTKQSLFAEVKHRLGRPVLDVSYRYMTDDWGVRSHTVDFRWRQLIGESWYVQPHLRYYTQSEADFYRPYLRNGDPLPQYAAADYRLGKLDGVTLGVKFGRLFTNAREGSVRIEYFRQAGRGPPGAAFGSLSGLDLFPSVHALIGQLEYRF